MRNKYLIPLTLTFSYLLGCLIITALYLKMTPDQAWFMCYLAWVTLGFGSFSAYIKDKQVRHLVAELFLLEAVFRLVALFWCDNTYDYSLYYLNIAMILSQGLYSVFKSEIINLLLATWKTLRSLPKTLRR